MFILIFTLMSFCAQALMLPPGFVVRQFGHTRDKLATARIEQKVSYKEDTNFSETVLFKAPNKYKIVISSNNGNVTFVRNGDKCLAVSAQKRIELLCQPLKTLFYHNVLLTSNDGFIDFLKQLKINPREGIVSIKQSEEDSSYVKPEGIVLVNYNSKPMYIVGISDGLYRDAVNASSGKPSISTALVDEIKYKAPQMWVDKGTFCPLRIFGQRGSDDLDVSLGSYITDGNEVPFPKAISLLLKGNKELSATVSMFESGVEIKDDTFAMDALKKLPSIKQEQLEGNVAKIVEYLGEYR